MTGREWKPGDIAHGSIQGYTGRLIFRGERDGWDEIDGTDSGWDGDYIADLRRLVVIDPEDDVQVARLRTALKRNYGTADDFGVQAALREFANPIPPQCTAALIVKGEHFYCDSDAGHGLPHGNSAAEAIWGDQA